MRDAFNIHICDFETIYRFLLIGKTYLCKVKRKFFRNSEKYCVNNGSTSQILAKLGSFSFENFHLLKQIK